MALGLATTLLVVLSACGHATQTRTMAIALINGQPGFTPQAVTVDKENRVVMRVNNATNAAHGFTIEGYGPGRVIDGGQSDELRFRASRAGTFKIYCQLHPAHQTSTFVVR